MKARAPGNRDGSARACRPDAGTLAGDPVPATLVSTSEKLMREITKAGSDTSFADLTMRFIKTSLVVLVVQSEAAAIRFRSPRALPNRPRPPFHSPSTTLSSGRLSSIRQGLAQF